MKLRNKKTGGLATLVENEDCLTLKTDAGFHHYFSLVELNKEWEDYEEPKDYFVISIFGDIERYSLHSFSNFQTQELKQIGNYFETKEEAEKAVEKLKAWKRLKGEIVGWSFSYDLDLNGCGFNDEDIVVGIKLPRNASKKDLDLLFCPEAKNE